MRLGSITHTSGLAALCIFGGLLGGLATHGAETSGSQPSVQSTASAQTNAPVRVDAATGLKVAANWELARAHCGACHSYRLVTANRGDRNYWLETLRWMQRTQNLWPIPEAQEILLLDYLAANYDDTEWGRRPPLSPSLLPSSPVTSGN